MKFFIKSILALSLGLIVSSCNNKEITIEPEQVTTVPDYTVEDGYLRFSDRDAYLKTKDMIANMSEEERENWEEGIGFLSQRRIVSNIIKAEEVKDQECIALYADKDITGLPESIFHSDLYNKYLANGVIKLIDEGTPDQYWDYSVYNLSCIDYMNEDGLFAIGDTLYHMNESRLIAGLLSEKQALIDATILDNNFKMIDSKLSSKSASFRSPGYMENVGWVTEGKQRINMRIYLDVYLFSASTSHYEFYHDVLVQCQKKNVWGNWKYETTELWVDGQWNMRIFYNSVDFTNTYSWHGNANYLKVSVNPETGSSVPYQSYFIISSDNPSTWDSECSPIYTTCNWTATRWGGASGITETYNMP